jgi:hypothetical protein
LNAALKANALLYPTWRAIANQRDVPLAQFGPGVAGGHDYLIGAVLLTIAVNVPLNNQLAALSLTNLTLTGPSLPAHWHHFTTVWTLASHFRALFSLGGCALLATAMLLGAPARQQAMTGQTGPGRPGPTAGPQMHNMLSWPR